MVFDLRATDTQKRPKRFDIPEEKHLFSDF